MLKLLLAASLIGSAVAECPNACSGHGSCGQFDMCTCYNNWQAADCSQRTCAFGLAHVDTPKGDLDHDNAIDLMATTVIASSTVYPSGTQEIFPKMVDSEGNAVLQSAHYYMECSNKGTCDRTTGTCECFDGYDGVSCQRASCPNDCSGHGTCETIQELANDEFSNVYELWDKDMTMGCKCDAGYSAADCSERECKYGVDPLYIDDTVGRYTTVNVRIETKSASTLSGTYALRFWDVHGEDYVTGPITAQGTGVDANSVNQCTHVLAALQALPNEVVSDQTICSFTAINTNKGFNLRLKFLGNPGYLKPLEIETYLDGSVSTLVDSANKLTAVVSAEVTGEFTDYFASKCDGITAHIKASDSGSVGIWDSTAVLSPAPGSLGYISGLTTAQEKLLKACLGDSNGDLTDNTDVYNWDYGSMAEYQGVADLDNAIGSFPHAIKTVPVTQTSDTITEFHLVWFDNSKTSGFQFRVANLPNHISSASVSSYIHTTDGVVQQLGVDRFYTSTASGAVAAADNELSDGFNETRVVGLFSQYSNVIYTNIDASCESGSAKLHNCVEKGDLLFVVDGCWGDGGPIGSYFGDNELYNCATPNDAAKSTGNLFTVNKIYTKPFTANTTQYFQGYTKETKGTEDRYVIEVDYNIGWDGSALGNPMSYAFGRHTGVVILFKFTPASTGSGAYTYVSECSNRGACDRDTGLCTCFKGYTSDNCSVQSSLAV